MIVSEIGRYVVMVSSILSEDVTVTKCPSITDRISFQKNNVLPFISDNYSFTRTRYTFDSLLVSFDNSNPPSIWYNLSNNNDGSLFELPRVKECIFDSVLSKCGIIRHKVVKGNNNISILKDNWR